jgi:hypothetical protein
MLKDVGTSPTLGRAESALSDALPGGIDASQWHCLLKAKVRAILSTPQLLLRE